MGYKVITRPCNIVGFKARDSYHQPLDRWRKQRTSSPGTISLNSKRKIKSAIRWLVASATTKQVYEKQHQAKVNWKINCITLTFHENLQDDALARKILSEWLEVAKYRWQMYNYVWKAEPQERGAIHFHLCSQVYVPHAELRYTWNRALRKRKLNNINDNSTDVHAVTHARNLESYLCDYLINEKKHDGRRLIKGKLWGCNQALARAGKQYVYMDDWDYQALQNDLQHYEIGKQIQSEGRYLPEWLKFIDLWNIKPSALPLGLMNEITQLYNSEIATLQARAKGLQLWPIEAPWQEQQ